MKKLSFFIGITMAVMVNGQNINTQFPNLKNGKVPDSKLVMKANSNSDTVWIYKIMEYYNWEGNEYVPFLYEVSEYKNELFPDKPSRLISVDPSTNDSVGHIIYYYDSSGYKTQSLYQEYDFSNNLWDNIENIFFYYNNNKLDTCQIVQEWNNDSNIWVNSNRYFEDYDTNGYQTLYAQEKWENDKWERFYGNKYVFDDKECMDTAYWYDWIPDVVGHWQKDLIKIWHYDSCGIIYEYIFKKWDMSSQSWINYQKFTDIEHINWTGCHGYNYSFSEDEDPEFTTFTFYHWFGDHWEPIKRTVNATADSLGGFHYETQEWNDNQWKDIFIVDRVVNKDGFIIFNKVQVNQDFLGVWKIIFADTVLLEYDGPRLTKYEVMWLDTTGGVQQWKPFQKYLYKDYFYVMNTNRYQQNNYNKYFKIIPNPSKTSIQIELNDNTDKIKSVKVYDMAGKSILQRKYNAKSVREKVNISSLTKGVYILNVITKGGKMMKGKFVKN